MGTSTSRLVSATAVAATSALLACAPSAGAATGWTTPESFGGTDSELTPRAGIADDGTSAVAWSTRCCKARALVVSTGQANGHFSAPRVIVRRRPNDYSVAAGRGGAFLVAWGEADGVRVAVRTSTGRPLVTRRIFASTTSQIVNVQVAADPRGGWVVVATDFPKKGSSITESHVYGVSLDAEGRRLRPAQDLGAGHFGSDARQTQALAVDREGRASFAFTRDVPLGRIAIVSARPNGGLFSVPVAVPGVAVEPRVAVGSGGRAVIALTQAYSCGEAFCSGPPALALLPAGVAPGSPFGPSLTHPNRAFAPTAALIASSRGVLVFLLKTKPSPFAPEAPVRAVTFAADGTRGPLQTLTPGLATEPAVMTLSGGRALALWAERRSVAVRRFTIGAALAGTDGRFHKTAVPNGPAPEPGHINPTNRDLHTAGRYAIFAWEGNGRARISIRHF